MRLPALQRLTAPRQAPDRSSRESSSEIVMELDRWQVTGLLAAVCVFCAGAFAAGLAVGKDAQRDAGTAPALDLRTQPDDRRADTRDRQLSLAEVSPSTDRLSLDLARPVADPETTNPAERARIATHRALQEARATGLRQVDGAEVPDLPLAMIGQAAPGEEDPAEEAGANAAHALAVTTFSNEASAEAMANALKGMARAPHAPRVRRIIADGQVAWRVEIGRFTSFKEATAFQREFQAESGYLVGLVAVP